MYTSNRAERAQGHILGYISDGLIRDLKSSYYAYPNYKK